jgi:hypothetical protein
MNLKVHYHDQKSLSLDPVMSPINHVLSIPYSRSPEILPSYQCLDLPCGFICISHTSHVYTYATHLILRDFITNEL